MSNILPAIMNANQALTNSARSAINPLIQDVSNSPGGQLIQGNLGNVLPSIKKEFQDLKSGKYKPQIQYAGEAGGGDFAKPGMGLPNISQDQPKPLPKTQFNVVDKVTAPDANKSVFGSEHTANIQDTLKRNGVQDYSQIATAAHNLYDSTIKPTLSNVPKLINIDDITNTIVGEMRKMKPGLDPTTAKTAANSVINDMYDNARGIAGAGKPVPTHIDTPSVFGIKQDLNSTQAVKNYFNGNPPQDINDLAIVASRNALGKVISTAHPEIAQATKDYGLLQDSVPSIYKATNQAAADLANTPKPDPMSYIPGSPLLGKGLNKLGNKILTNPVGQKIGIGTGLVGAGAAGGLGMASGILPNIIGGFNKQNQGNAQQIGGDGQNGKSNIHSNGIIDQPFSNIKPNPDGTYSLPQSSPTGQNQRHYTTPQDYQTSLNNLAQQYPAGDKDPAYTVAKTQLDAQYGADQKQANEVFQGNNIKNFMDNATTYNSDGNSLLNTLHNMPNAQGFWNGVSKAGSIRAYTDPAYTSELQQIDSFNNEFASAYESVTGKKPTDNQLLSSANSADQAARKFNAMMQYMSGTYGKYVNPYLAITSGTGTQTQTGTPRPIVNNSPQAPSGVGQAVPGMVQPGLEDYLKSLPPIQ